MAEILGANLRRICEEKGVSRKQLAEAVGVTEVSICGYETGRKLPPLDKIFVMADFLKVSVTSLTGDNGYNPYFSSTTDISSSRAIKNAVETGGTVRVTREQYARLEALVWTRKIVVNALDEAYWKLSNEIGKEGGEMNDT